MMRRSPAPPVSKFSPLTPFLAWGRTLTAPFAPAGARAGVRDTSPGRARALRSASAAQPPPAPALSVHTIAAIVGFLAVWRLSIFVLSYAAEIVGPGSCGLGAPWPISYSACWDTEWYQRIANNGYTGLAAAEWPLPTAVAFFPGFPLLMSLLDRVLPGGAVLAGLAVSHLALLGAAVYIYQIVRLEFAERVAWRTLLFLLIFPGALFFSVVYAESLLLLGLAGSLYHARRGQWVRAGLFGVVASGTKLVGITIALPLLVEALAQHRRIWERPRAVAGVLLAPCGALGYFVYLQALFGDFRVFFNAHSTGWYRETLHPMFHLGIDRLLGNMGPALKFYPPEITPLHSYNLLLDTTLLLVFVIAGIVLWFRVRQSYGALVLAVCLVLGFSGHPQDLHRVLSVLFPAFILLGRIQSEPLRNALVIPSALGLALTTYFFVNNQWAG
ncbi:MAG: hypothetical protein GEU73_15570 [Chloroflexi bacterium]|nr:hypothetical protein [Chloroflexota bacterium]